jgi:hypothetical protein
MMGGLPLDERISPHAGQPRALIPVTTTLRNCGWGLLF